MAYYPMDSSLVYSYSAGQIIASSTPSSQMHKQLFGQEILTSLCGNLPKVTTDSDAPALQKERCFLLQGN